MARHITAKKQLTRERALALIDEDIAIHQEILEDCQKQGYNSIYSETSIKALDAFRQRLEWACDTGVFPPSK